MNAVGMTWSIGSFESQQNLEERGFNGNTPLLMAAMQGDLPTVARLIEAGADVYAVNNDHNGVLFNCCYADSPELIRYLAEHGADVNDVNEEGVTPLMYAASAGRVRCVQVLLELGANPALVSDDGLSAAEYASTKEVLILLRRRA